MTIAITLVLLLSCAGATLADESAESEFFAVEVDGDHELAQVIALQHHFSLERKLESLGNVYIFRRQQRAEATLTNYQNWTKSLTEHPQVRHAEPQIGLARAKRGGWRNLQKRILLIHEPTAHELKEVKPADAAIQFNDPLFKYEWYLDNKGQLYGSEKTRELRDINVAPAWLAGISGQGVVTCIIDDAVQFDHPDLIANFDVKASVNMVERDSMYPVPPFWSAMDGHGTECAGIIAAMANNSKCGVGVAFNSKIGGIRLLGPIVITDTLEAEALTSHSNYCTSYSLSWGPTDNGIIMEGPARYAAKALEVGARHGRGGLGNLYVMASGNGGEYHDHCGADGYVNNLHTIAITSLNPLGETTFFDETCAAILAGVYIGGAENISESPLRFFTKPNVLAKQDPELAEKILPGMYGASTTGIKSRCAVNFFGTSAAAPLALGCFALLLEANPKLSWRDVQHIVAHTARVPIVNDSYNVPWLMNGAGLHFNSRVGFGALDCSRMVAFGQQWRPAAEQHRCVAVEQYFNIPIISDATVQIPLPDVDGCIDDPVRSVTRLEHVLLFTEIDYPQRGALTINLVSPAGTRSELLGYRPNDHFKNGLRFEFKTLANWDESPNGTWTIEIHANYPNIFAPRRRQIYLEKLRNGTLDRVNGTLSRARLVLYGTSNKPSRSNEASYVIGQPELLKIIEKEEELARSVKPQPMGDEARSSTHSQRNHGHNRQNKAEQHHHRHHHQQHGS